MGLRISSGLAFVNWIHWRTYFPAPINAALWSIGIEVWFYIMLPVWALGLRVFKGRIHSAAYWAVTQLAIVGVQVLILNRIHPWGADSTSSDSLQRYALDLVPTHNPWGLFSHFLFGSAAAVCLTTWSSLFHHEEQRPCRWNRFDVLGVLCLAGLSILVHPKMLPGPFWSTGVSRAQIWAMHYQWPLFPALTAALLVSMHHSQQLGKLLDNRLLSGVCKLSYGIYLWHMVVLNLFSRICPWSLDTLSRQITGSLVSLVITVGLASLSYRLIERPAMQLLKRRQQAVVTRTSTSTLGVIPE